MRALPRSLLALAATALLAGACASTTESNTGRTATEQLLIARAAERAIEGLTLPVEADKRVFVDDTYFRGENALYAVSAVRAALSASGHALASNRAEADVIMEMRSGALSLEQMRRLVGLPAMSVPIAERLSVFTIPELSLYSSRDRIGVAEFSAFLYDARTGAPLGAIAPMTGQYRIRSHRLLMMVTWGQQSVQPGEVDLGPSWREW